MNLSPLGSMMLAAMVLVGCVQTANQGARPTGSPTQPVLPTLPPNSAPTPTADTTTQGGGAVPPELVGTWTQDTTANAPAGYFLRKAYRFDPDGTYALLSLICLDGGTCSDADPPEAGIATVRGNQLSLSPQTQSVEGPRTYTFTAGRDPDNGLVLLDFYLPDYTDEFMYQP